MNKNLMLWRYELENNWDKAVMFDECEVRKYLKNRKDGEISLHDFLETYETLDVLELEKHCSHREATKDEVKIFSRYSL